MKLFSRVQKLIAKEKITETIYLIKYTLDIDLEWKPGQYVGIQATSTHRRAYSIYRAGNGEISFLIDISPGGIASKFFEKVDVGAESLILGPYGRFFPQENDREIVLIATGTGIAPFISWFEDFRSKGIEKKFSLIFGCRRIQDEIGYRYFAEFLNEESEIVHCISRENKPLDYEENFPNAQFFNGRVTHYLESLPTLNPDVDYYICGNDNMVEDVEEILKNRSVGNIFFEKYG